MPRSQRELSPSMPKMMNFASSTDYKGGKISRHGWKAERLSMSTNKSASLRVQICFSLSLLFSVAIWSISPQSFQMWNGQKERKLSLSHKLSCITLRCVYLTKDHTSKVIESKFIFSKGTDWWINQTILTLIHSILYSFIPFLLPPPSLLQCTSVTFINDKIANK